MRDKKILTLLAHPDDETLGCGGTLHRMSQEGAAIHCVIPCKFYLDYIDEACRNALGILGISSAHFGDFDDNQLDKYPIANVTKFFEKQLNRLKPDFVFLHHWNCTNQDHRVCYQAGVIATRNSKATLLCCEVPSSTGYLKPVNYEPNFYVTLEKQNIEARSQAMEQYKSEVKKPPSIRSIDKLTTHSAFRGGEINCEYAEAFVKIREII